MAEGHLYIKARNICSRKYASHFGMTSVYYLSLLALKVCRLTLRVWSRWSGLSMSLTSPLHYRSFQIRTKVRGVKIEGLVTLAGVIFFFTNTGTVTFRLKRASRPILGSVCVCVCLSGRPVSIRFRMVAELDSLLTCPACQGTRAWSGMPCRGWEASSTHTHTDTAKCSWSLQKVCSRAHCSVLNVQWLPWSMQKSVHHWYNKERSYYRVYTHKEGQSVKQARVLAHSRSPWSTQAANAGIFEPGINAVVSACFIPDLRSCPTICLLQSVLAEGKIWWHRKYAQHDPAQFKDIDSFIGILQYTNCYCCIWMQKS